MGKTKINISNNILAAIAIVVILVSSLNTIYGLKLLQSKHSAATVSASGEVKLCASFTPNMTILSYYEVNQSDVFYLDVDVTQDEDGVMYSDNTDLFNITPDSGIISFIPGNDDVGEHNVTITAIETTCYEFFQSLNITINVTDINDPPVLDRLILESNEYGFQQFIFPMANLNLYEDVQYNVTLVATDEDIKNGDYLEYWAVWYETPFPPPVQVGGVFVLNKLTGFAQFMPVQDDVDTYVALFYVEDTFNETAYDYVDVEVINVNDDPVLENKTDIIGGLGVMQVVWGHPFYYDINATDEDGDTLTYSVNIYDCAKLNATDLNCSVFEPDNITGEINFTPPFGDVGNYTVNYTVTDGNGGVDRYTGNFSITEFPGNQAPNITDWFPRTDNMSKYIANNVTLVEGDDQRFNITVVDDTPWRPYWFIDGVLVAGEETETFIFDADYEDSGVYNITVIASDGELIDWHEWELIVLDKDPPKKPSGRKRTSKLPPCIENWRCTVWADCSNEGIQIRTCVDLSECGTVENKPEMSRNCVFTPYPNCYDGILNCHNGACEILTDCGGPCPDCPTCSDNIRNCHINGECEEAVDCGGPCRPCPIEPVVIVCGNQICESGELYECTEDCLDFWIDISMFILIIILLIIVTILLYVYKKETVLLYIYKRIGR